jgi:hypothetical protein
MCPQSSAAPACSIGPSISRSSRRARWTIPSGSIPALVAVEGLELAGGAQRTVVGLVDRAAAVRIGEQGAGPTKVSAYGSLNGVVTVNAAQPRCKRERWMPFLERAEADSLALL